MRQKLTHYQFLLSYVTSSVRIRRSFKEHGMRFVTRVVYAASHEAAGCKILGIVQDMRSKYDITGLGLDYEVYVGGKCFDVKDIISDMNIHNVVDGVY